MSKMIDAPFEKALLDYRVSVLGYNYPIVWSFFCDSEKYWSKKRTKILASSQRTRILNNLDESALWLARENDYVILIGQPSDDFLNQIPTLKIPKSQILFCKTESDLQDMPEALCKNESIQDKIKSLVQRHGKMGYFSFGYTNLDKEFVEKTGLTSMTASPDIAAHVNTKIFSRNLCNTDVLFPVVPGQCCKTADEIRNTYQKLISNHQSSKVVIKDPDGVSGKGIFIFDNAKKFENWLDFHQNHQDLLPEYIVESWIESKYGFNHSFLLYPNGNWTPLALKKSILDKGRHRSHLDPLEISKEHQQTLLVCQSHVARELHKNGYFGFVGIDGIMSDQNKMYPLIEINARINWSAAQLFLRDFLPANSVYKVTEIPFTINNTKALSSLNNLMSFSRSSTKNSGMIIQLERPLRVNINSFRIIESSLFCILYGPNIQIIENIELEISKTIEELANL